MKTIANICILFLILLLSACDQPKQKKELDQRKEKIEAHESKAVTPEQDQRKEKSMAYVKAKGFNVMEKLPVIESAEETTIRSKEEIVNRALALCYMGLKSEGLEKAHLDGFEKKYQLAEHFTKDELKYKNASKPSDQQTTDANWKYEGLHVLLWSMGYIDELVYPDVLCNVGDDVKAVFSRSREQLISEATFRSKEEILDQADLIYRINWACVNARVKGTPPPAGLNQSVVYERHYALNWLINYMDQDWDNVSTDT